MAVVTERQLVAGAAEVGWQEEQVAPCALRLLGTFIIRLMCIA